MSAIDSEESSCLTIVLGEVTSEPRSFERRDGTVVVSFDVVTLSGPRESVPISVPDPATKVASIRMGDLVVVVGRTRRRFYRAGDATRSVTEVVASSVTQAG